MKRSTMWSAGILAVGGLLGCLVVSADEPKKETPGQSLGIASVANLRDIGGYKTRDGFTVRTKLLYRSNQLSKIGPDDLKKVASLSLKNDYDLRTADERKAAPDELPPGVKNIWLNVLEDSKQAAPAKIIKLLQNPKEANVELGDGLAEATFAKSYRDFVSLPSARKAFRQFYVDLGKEDNLPSLFHCTTGKDRTGWAAAALLSLLGVPDDTIMDDYLRSNDYILPAYQKTTDSFTKAGGDPEIIKAILGVKAEYLKASFDEMKTKYGTIEDYFSKALEIDAAGQKALRDRFLIRVGE
jgi:protein-tyrosine phosphatase